MSRRTRKCGCGMEYIPAGQIAKWGWRLTIKETAERRPQVTFLSMGIPTGSFGLYFDQQFFEPLRGKILADDFTLRIDEP